MTNTDDTRIPAADAAERVHFDLTYTVEKGRRPLHEGGLDGESIPNAYHHARKITGDTAEYWRGDLALAPGSWNGDMEVGDYDEARNVTVATPEQWTRFWFDCALNEVIHEGLEWFWVDGRPLLDPHGPHEMAVFKATQVLADALWALAETESGS